MAFSNIGFMEHCYGYQESTHTRNSSEYQYDAGIILTQKQQPAYQQISQPTSGDANLNYQMTSNQPCPSFQSEITSAVPTPSVQGDANINYKITSCHPYQALERCSNSVSPTRAASSDANINYQMTSIQPSPAFQNVINSAVPTPSVQGDANINFQISSIHTSLAPQSMIHAAASIPSARGDDNIGYEMTSSQPSLALLHAINAATSKSSTHGDDNTCYDMTSSLLLPGLYDLPTFVKPTVPKRNVGMSKDAQQRLNNWYECNKHHPYANAEATRMLARTCSITDVQVRKWLSNKRMRNKRPKTSTASNNETDCGFITVQIVCK